MSKVADILTIMRADTIDMDALEAALNEASHDERVAASREFSGKLQKKLYEASKGRDVTLDYMVPTDEPLKEVIHVGTNTLPAFRHFEKRFCRPSSDEHGDVLWGYNHNWYWPVTTPGYYAAYQNENGELWVDYTRDVPEKPADWPPLMPNNRRLGHVVFKGMVDRVRRVSDHVTIGRAYKKKAMNAWFVLVRTD